MLFFQGRGWKSGECKTTNDLLSRPSHGRGASGRFLMLLDSRTGWLSYGTRIATLWPSSKELRCFAQKPQKRASYPLSEGDHFEPTQSLHWRYYDTFRYKPKRSMNVSVLLSKRLLKVGGTVYRLLLYYSETCLKRPKVALIGRWPLETVAC